MLNQIDRKRRLTTILYKIMSFVGTSYVFFSVSISTVLTPGFLCSTLMYLGAWLSARRNREELAANLFSGGTVFIIVYCCVCFGTSANLIIAYLTPACFGPVVYFKRNISYWASVAVTCIAMVVSYFVFGHWTPIIEVPKRFATAFEFSVTATTFMLSIITLFYLVSFKDKFEDELLEKNRHVRSILENIKHGIFTINKHQNIDPDFSKFLAELLDLSQINKISPIQLLFKESSLGADQISIIQSILASTLDENLIIFEMNAHLLPREIHSNIKGKMRTLEIDWIPITDQDTVEKIMVVLKDVTELRNLLLRASVDNEKSEIVNQILAIGIEAFHDFTRFSSEALSKARKGLAAATKPESSIIDSIFRDLHTIKGVARTYRLMQLTDTVHQAEQIFQDMRDGKRSLDSSSLLEESIVPVSDKLNQYKSVAEQKLGDLAKPSIDSEIVRAMAKAMLAKGSQRAMQMDNACVLLCRKKFAPMRMILEREISGLSFLAERLGKETPSVEFIGDQLITMVHHNLIRNVFVHILRNFIDHGVETKAERLANGKSPAGKVVIETIESDMSWLTIRVSDDGRGLNLNKVYKKAVSLKHSLNLNDRQAVAESIFLPGISTAESVTEISGRGVGLDAVKTALVAQGCTIKIRLGPTAPLEQGQPFCFEIRLPT